MKLLTRRDVGCALITGLTAGGIAWAVLAFLQKDLPLGIPLPALVIIVPICWLLGVQFGYFLGRWLSFFDQFGKYAAIGFTNFAVDAGIFNLLISLTHATSGVPYAVQKTTSFVIAVMHSYGWNRWWAFHRESNGSVSAVSSRSEFIKFLTVNIIAAAVNVGVATVVVSLLHRPTTITPEVWANIGAVAGSASALIFSFIGLKLIVFKSNSPDPSYR